MTSTDMEHAALQYLCRVADKDPAKGGTGIRSTVDVAEYLSIKTATARRLLNGLCERDLVECFDDLPLAWRITPSGRAKAGAR